MEAPAADRDSDGRWHYKRSLASRVTLLTTFAVGLTVAFVALGAYVTVRVQMQSTLDASLLDRAERAAQSSTLGDLNDMEMPSWAFGAADVRIAFLWSDGTGRSIDGAGDLPLGKPELRVAQGKRDHAIRTVEADGERYRVVTVPSAVEPGRALIIAQSLDSQEQVLDRLGLVMLCFGLAGVIVAGLAGWGWPATACVRSAGSPPRRRRSLAPTGSRRSRSRAPTRSLGSPAPSTRCCSHWTPHARASDSSSQTPATSSAPSHLPPHQPRPAHPGRCHRRPPRRGEERAARGRARADRRDDHADR